MNSATSFSSTGGNEFKSVIVGRAASEKGSCAPLVGWNAPPLTPFAGGNEFLRPLLGEKALVATPFTGGKESRETLGANSTPPELGENVLCMLPDENAPTPNNESPKMS
jgi:hypothetical protein